MTTTEPLVFTFTIACLPVHAFKTWTEKIDRWWPKDHSLSGDPEPKISIEGFAGGRIVEQGDDGTEYEWGRVTHWDPPSRLVYSWFPGASPEKPTTVELTFDEQDGQTVVCLTNTGWDQFETDGHIRRENNNLGWSAALHNFRNHLEQQ